MSTHATTGDARTEDDIVELVDAAQRLELDDRLEEALGCAARALSLAEDLASRYPADVRHSRSVGAIGYQVGGVELRLGRPDRAGAVLERALAAYGLLGAAAAGEIADVQVRLGRALAHAGRVVSALVAVQRGLTHYARRSGPLDRQRAFAFGPEVAAAYDDPVYAAAALDALLAELVHDIEQDAHRSVQDGALARLPWAVQLTGVIDGRGIRVDSRPERWLDAGAEAYDVLWHRYRPDPSPLVLTARWGGLPTPPLLLHAIGRAGGCGYRGDAGPITGADGCLPALRAGSERGARAALDVCLEAATAILIDAEDRGQRDRPGAVLTLGREALLLMHFLRDANGGQLSPDVARRWPPIRATMTAYLDAGGASAIAADLAANDPWPEPVAPPAGRPTGGTRWRRLGPALGATGVAVVLGFALVGIARHDGPQGPAAIARMDRAPRSPGPGKRPTSSRTALPSGSPWRPRGTR